MRKILNTLKLWITKFASLTDRKRKVFSDAGLKSPAPVSARLRYLERKAQL